MMLWVRCEAIMPQIVGPIGSPEMTARVEVVPERELTGITAVKRNIVKEITAGVNGGVVIGKYEDENVSFVENESVRIR